jgi:hypothetical protein
MLKCSILINSTRVVIISFSQKEIITKSYLPMKLNSSTNDWFKKLCIIFPVFHLSGRGLKTTASSVLYFGCSNDFVHRY